jgi:hypothetical protein
MHDVHICRLGKFRSGACNLPDHKRHRGGYSGANDANICVFALCYISSSSTPNMEIGCPDSLESSMRCVQMICDRGRRTFRGSRAACPQMKFLSFNW